MSADLSTLFGAEAAKVEFPPMPDAAYLLGCTFLRLGGSFAIGSNGQRYCGRPLGAMYDLQGEEYPQLPDASPSERFHSEDEWQGALKLIDALMHRMAKSDRDLLFDLFAPVAVDERKFKPSIEEPKRRAA